MRIRRQLPAAVRSEPSDERRATVVPVDVHHAGEAFVQVETGKEREALQGSVGLHVARQQLRQVRQPGHRLAADGVAAGIVLDQADGQRVNRSRMDHPHPRRILWPGASKEGSKNVSRPRRLAARARDVAVHMRVTENEAESVLNFGAAQGR